MISYQYFVVIFFSNVHHLKSSSQIDINLEIKTWILYSHQDIVKSFESKIISKLRKTKHVKTKQFGMQSK